MFSESLTIKERERLLFSSFSIVRIKKEPIFPVKWSWPDFREVETIDQVDRSLFTQTRFFFYPFQSFPNEELRETISSESHAPSSERPTDLLNYSTLFLEAQKKKEKRKENKKKEETKDGKKAKKRDGGAEKKEGREKEENETPLETFAVFDGSQWRKGKRKR